MMHGGGGFYSMLPFDLSVCVFLLISTVIPFFLHIFRCDAKELFTSSTKKASHRYSTASLMCMCIILILHTLEKKEKRESRTKTFMLCNLIFNSIQRMRVYVSRMFLATPSKSRLSKIIYYLQTINKTFFGLTKQAEKTVNKKPHQIQRTLNEQHFQRI